MRIIAFCAAGLALAACETMSNETYTEPAVNRAAEINSLMAADRAWAADVETNPNPDEAFAAGLSNSAVFIAPGAPPVEGRANIADMFYEMASAPGFSLSWDPVTAEVSEDASLGYTLGRFEQTMNDANGYPVSVTGNYVTMWRKQPDGRWLAVADAGTTDAPPVTTLK